MRIVLLCPAERGATAVERLGQGLRGFGHEVDVLALRGDQARARIATVADRALAKRGFVTPLAPALPTVAALLARSYEVAHAFSIPEAQAALMWRRLRGGRVVFTCVEPVERARLADRRLRLRLTRGAYEDSDVVTAASPQAQAALGRWLALDAPVIELGDASSYERLYRTLAS